jgi:hypothetical protein
MRCPIMSPRSCRGSEDSDSRSNFYITERCAGKIPTPLEFPDLLAAAQKLAYWSSAAWPKCCRFLCCRRSALRYFRHLESAAAPLSHAPSRKLGHSAGTARGSLEKNWDFGRCARTRIARSLACDCDALAQHHLHLIGLWRVIDRLFLRDQPSTVQAKQ